MGREGGDLTANVRHDWRFSTREGESMDRPSPLNPP